MWVLAGAWEFCLTGALHALIYLTLLLSTMFNNTSRCLCGYLRVFASTSQHLCRFLWTLPQFSHMLSHNIANYEYMLWREDHWSSIGLRFILYISPYMFCNACSFAKCSYICFAVHVSLPKEAVPVFQCTLHCKLRYLICNACSVLQCMVLCRI